MRTYAPMKRQSDKVQHPDPVYRLVDQRSDGRCEYGSPGPLRCRWRASDHHHLLKPRRSHHDPDLIVHLCRAHHDRCDWPYSRGRLIVTALGAGRFSFSIRYEKFTP